jgi:GTP-binding protein
MSAKLPSVVIVGRPNVGKSTLFNRLTGTRRSIVTDEPGITRDRIYGTAVWRGRPFEVVDTGGIVPDEKAEMPREILRQARVAIENAAQVILVTDARAGLTPLDDELARRLRRAGKPFAVAANKVDTPAQAPLAGTFYELGADVFPISADHGFGVDDLLDAVTAGFPAVQEHAEEQAIRVAIIGRPNVGKSTLLNRLVGSERAIVSAEPGTTRDAVDTIIRRGDRAYRFIDTAGIRRKEKTKLLAERLSVMMARKHLKRADIALLVMDAAQGATSQDAAIAGYAEQSGRSVILVMNKWDFALEAARWKPSKAKPPTERKQTGAEMDPGRLMSQYEPLIRAKLRFLPYAPLVFLSALTGERVGRLFDLIARVAEARQRRISTGELNRWLGQLDAGRGTAPAARQVKILYMTQASVAPPTFVLFTNRVRRLHFSFGRYLENRLREKFDFTGTPVRFVLRPRKPFSAG